MKLKYNESIIIFEYWTNGSLLYIPSCIGLRCLTMAGNEAAGLKLPLIG